MSSRILSNLDRLTDYISALDANNLDTIDMRACVQAHELLRLLRGPLQSRGNPDWSLVTGYASLILDTLKVNSLQKMVVRISILIIATISFADDELGTLDPDEKRELIGQIDILISWYSSFASLK